MRTLVERQGLQAGCPEEIAFEKGWIDAAKLAELIEPYKKTAYGAYLQRLLDA